MWDYVGEESHGMTKLGKEVRQKSGQHFSVVYLSAILYINAEPLIRFNLFVQEKLNKRNYVGTFG